MPEPVTCTRRIHFSAGHRVFGHESKCANVHGHNYVAWFEAVAPLDPIGRVMDFSVLKERIGGWIDQHWDHGLLLSVDDKQLFAVLDHMNQKLYRMSNPTAENMANHLLFVVCPAVLLGTGVTVTSVRISETENCEATARL